MDHFLTPETPPGCMDALDLDTGTWWRVRSLTTSELMAEGITPLVSVVAVDPTDMGATASPPPPTLESAYLSERVIAASVAAASAVSGEVYDAYVVARAKADEAAARRAAVQRLVDQGGDADALGLAAAVELANETAAAMQAAREAVCDVSSRRPWKHVRVTLDRNGVGEGVFHYSEVPPSSLAAIGGALSQRREASAAKLRSFLGG